MIRLKFLLLPLLLLSAASLTAQYYYDDILVNRQLAMQREALLRNRVRTINATGVDRNGTRATDFSEFHELKESGAIWAVTTIRNLDKTVQTTRFDREGRVLSITDSTSSIVNRTRFSYDNQNRLSRVENRVEDSAGNFNQTEIHQWLYKEGGRADKIWRIVQRSGAMEGTDSLEIRLGYDEDGNPSEERSYRRGVETGFLYYYYDEARRLTDIVRYNKKLQKLLPDVMFEYDEQNRVIQKITTTSSATATYLIWRYIYNAEGLKTKEALFNGQKELTGRIDYSYSFQ
jgi:hypothetical protein